MLLIYYIYYVIYLLHFLSIYIVISFKLHIKKNLLNEIQKYDEKRYVYKKLIESIK